MIKYFKNRKEAMIAVGHERMKNPDIDLYPVPKEYRHLGKHIMCTETEYFKTFNLKDFLDKCPR